MIVTVSKAWRFAAGSDAAKFFSRSDDVVIRVYDAAGNAIETEECKSEFIRH